MTLGLVETAPILLVLDIDGTLVDSISVHEHAYLQALQQHGYSRSDIDDASLLHYTDSWVFKSLFLAKYGRSPEKTESDQFEADFDKQFEKAFLSDSILPLKGAVAFLNTIIQSPGIQICFATGSFRQAACIKLSALSVKCDNWVLSSASEFYTREDIVRDSIERVSLDQKHTFRKVVVLGDGLWDQRTARNLGLDFVGINVPEVNIKRFEPDTIFFDDFSKPDILLSTLGVQKSAVDG